LTEQHAVRAKRSSRKRQTKPIEISHKSLALKELTSDGFGLLYAKQTQFRVVEAATLEGRRCRKPARRQLLPQPRYAQILTTDSAQQHPIEDPGGSETNHGIHRHTQKRQFGSALPFRVLPCVPWLPVVDDPSCRSKSLAHAGSGGPDWRGMGPADPETGQRVSSGCRRKSGGWRVASGRWRRPNGGWRRAGRMTSMG